MDSLFYRKNVELVKKVRLTNGKYPRFNDSFFSKDIKLDQIIILSESYLKEINFFKEESFYFELFDSFLPKTNLPKLKNFKFSFSDNSKIIDLPHTGWTILKPSSNLEIIFKGGKSCPDYLPAHAHSDILSFDLFKNGEPLILETGTSTYEKSSIREYERSAKSHNILLLSEDNLNFLEPLEVWDSFRVARKYKILSRDNGIDENKIWVKCSFKPISKFLISQERCIIIERNNDDLFELKIIDSIITKKELFWNFYLHFPPNYNPNKLKIFQNDKLLNLKYKNYKLIKSWTSFEYGKRLKSSSLIISGKFNSGFNQNVIKLNF